jgi:hypothetical protein
MFKSKIYFAGKIGKNDWRHSLVPSLSGRRWEDGAIETTHFVYTGPFFVSCDHGCNHVANSHGAAAGYFSGESPYTQHTVISNNNASLEQADLVFAYITAVDCYGTLIEMGSAFRAGQQVVIAFAPRIPYGDFWYGAQQARSVYHNVNESELPELLAKELGSLK